MSLGRALAFPIALVALSCSSDGNGVGEERGPCYPNSTCNQGLICASGICVRLPTADRGLADALDASRDGAKSDLPRKGDGPATWSQVTTVAGAAGPGFEDGPVATARFLAPAGVAVDGQKLYVADRDNHRIRLIDLGSGQVSTVAGTGAPGFADGPGASAQLNAPTGLAIGSGGALLVADAGNHRIRAVNAGVVSTVAGNGNPGSIDGPVASAGFNSPRGVVSDSFGVIYVADYSGSRVRKIAAGNVHGLTVGNFATPVGVAVNAAGTVLASSQGEHRIAQILPGGSAFTTLAGTAVAGFVDGNAEWAQFNGPAGICLKGSSLYVADTFNHRIRLVDSGKVSTIAGSKSGSQDGPTKGALFNLPYGVAADGSGNLYVADMGNNAIRRIAP